MPESFVVWNPIEVGSSSARLVSLRDDEDDGLCIRVDAAGRLVELAFGRVIAYRSTLEEASLDFWRRFHGARPAVGAFWMVEDSDWLATFTSADLCLYPDAKHYLIVTDDERIDVIASRAPAARIVHGS